MRKWIVAVAMIAGLPAAAMAADAENGKTVFNKCKACHQVDKNAVGPTWVASSAGRRDLSKDLPIPMR